MLTMLVLLYQHSSLVPRPPVFHNASRTGAWEQDYLHRVYNLRDKKFTYKMAIK